MKLLLTGFEPFLNYSINPTVTIVENLHEQKLEDFSVEGRLFPVEFREAHQQMISAIQEMQPDVVLSLGLAAGRNKITPERIAINCQDGDADNSGFKPVNQPIIPGGDAGIFSTLPTTEIVQTLTNAGFPAAISNTAGTYVCNTVMYAALRHIQEYSLPIQAGFIHIPASHELAIEHGNLPSWSQEDLIDGVKHCIQALTKNS
ncbi:pyroglutamyl-peptidase I [Pontibacillus litoralis]|uniref:Pyroglutamyl-peptidase I n=1 Tax=Pontibacillus litoralis JSM 072002 TaxID=1385512 RepID=A0A0A5G358_9BACI|nr:pyroglutamyl-peptidase I [Pontibacillus litoralis]KGX85563.1 peptidase C15 [Pontibacillus litoralis JSM 072002]